MKEPERLLRKVWTLKDRLTGECAFRAFLHPVHGTMVPDSPWGECSPPREKGLTKRIQFGSIPKRKKLGKEFSPVGVLHLAPACSEPPGNLRLRMG
jgi:hypothetical protein